MNKWFKKIWIPTEEKTSVIAYKSWIVRWYSWNLRDTSYGGRAYCTQMAEIFPSEKDANNFANQLREAFKLLKLYGEGSKVIVEQNQSTLSHTSI